MSEYIGIESNAGLLTITIRRPAAKNALNSDMYQAMSAAVDQVVASDDINVLLIRGQSGCFTSGNDLNDFVRLVKLEDSDSPVLIFMRKLAACPKVVVAEVDGLAIGIGATMLLHCDFVYISRQATFSMPFVKLGLCPEYASSFLLAKVVGVRKANEFLLLGREFDAGEALECGLVNKVCDHVIAETDILCRRLIALAPEALKQSKALIKSSMQIQIEQTIAEEVSVFTALLQGPEFAEAAAAFFEKRAPNFKANKP